MNVNTEHMIQKSVITAIILCLLPAAAAFGQQLKIEKLKGTNPNNPGTDYAVFYSAGMPESAIWPLGMKLSRDDGVTIRHTPGKGNDDNISVNDKVPFRFIIAKADGTAVTWAAAMGLNTSENNTLISDGTTATTGCASYSTTEFLSGWRMPTQREMMLMWLFREGINYIYGSAQLSGTYWSATESAADQAWYLDFSTTAPQSTIATKSATYKYRCVRDY